LEGQLEHQTYKKEIRALQIQLSRLQRCLIGNGQRTVVIFEGRDAAGKDGAIKRITQHLSPRETRVVALPPPTDRDQNSWYFQRFTAHLPAKQEFVFFNRSWYNRAGVERVMGYCTDHEYFDFLTAVYGFEKMLTADGIQIVKYYLDISEQEQAKRIEERRTDPLKQWKNSPVDAMAQSLWHEYSVARDRMLQETDSGFAPWAIIDADNKKAAQVNIIRDLLRRVGCSGFEPDAPKPNPDLVRPFSELGSTRVLYP